MRIGFGFKVQDGPWGGGNQFARNLIEYLRERGETVLFDLARGDIELLLLLEPRGHLPSSAFSDVDVLRYLLFKNSAAVVVHRVNECDERKHTLHMNRLLQQANRCADYTVFVSNWLRELHQNHGFVPKRAAVILNGSDGSIFNPQGFAPWNSGPLKIVTHHWSGNMLKGFDIYKRLDDLLGSQSFRERYSFTFIGNLPHGFEFKNSTHISPLFDQELAAKLKQHHLYLTASRNEPGSNHQNEAALCGLALLFIDSGSLPEYCGGYGISFDENTFEEKLEEVRENYALYASRMQSYPHTSQRTNAEYYNLFKSALSTRDEVIAGRRLHHEPRSILRAVLPDPRLYEKLKYKLSEWLHIQR